MQTTDICTPPTSPPPHPPQQKQAIKPRTKLEKFTSRLHMENTKWVSND